jgi:hypothetical protein
MATKQMAIGRRQSQGFRAKPAGFSRAGRFIEPMELFSKSSFRAGINRLEKQRRPIFCVGVARRQQPGAFSDPIESGRGSGFLFIRAFFTRTGIHFA